jgi:hypothetical protein
VATKRRAGGKSGGIRRHPEASRGIQRHPYLSSLPFLDAFQYCFLDLVRLRFLYCFTMGDSGDSDESGEEFEESFSSNGSSSSQAVEDAMEGVGSVVVLRKRKRRQILPLGKDKIFWGTAVQVLGRKSWVWEYMWPYDLNERFCLCKLCPGAGCDVNCGGGSSTSKQLQHIRGQHPDVEKARGLGLIRAERSQPKITALLKQEVAPGYFVPRERAADGRTEG